MCHHGDMVIPWQLRMYEGVHECIMGVYVRMCAPMYGGTKLMVWWNNNMHPLCMVRPMRDHWFKLSLFPSLVDLLKYKKYIA